ncbi:MAG: NADH-quinone oxidoreductase subunit L [Anaerolineales bacterium]|nr:NADH-quinone oxidoreductase subunit L [Anaerolineales bacterium]
MLSRLAPLIIFLPLAGLLINLAFGRRLGERFTGVVASSAVGLAFVVSVLQFFVLRVEHEALQVPIADWISIGALDVSWTMRLDTLSVAMMMMVTGVSTLIHIYAIGYMHADVRFHEDEGRYTRFFVFFNLFVTAMMILVSADNMLMMFVGWEGVGLCSYLLIGFWYDFGEGGIANALAGKKAFIVNRIGDFGFLMAMFFTFWNFGSLQFDEIAAQLQSGSADTGVVAIIALFLLLGVTGKSAQIPLFVWLPDAMAGPTPVSALIHAATMVTAGVYMVTRNAAVFNLAPGSANVVAWVGAATALFAATIAVGQFDIKKVLAYSTISQLGFMVAAVGMGAYVAGMFHLITHAFFKALLFLSAGSVIQGIEHGHHHTAHGHDDHGFDPNDMRNMGGLRSRMPTTYKVYLIGALALAGLPPLAGFFSKDEILADASQVNFGVYLLLAIAAVFTAFYMGRQILMVFFGESRSDAAEHAPENPKVMTTPLVLLAAGAVLMGALNLPGVHSLTHWLEHTLGHLHVPEFNVTVALVSTVLALLAIALAWQLYGKKPMTKGQPDPLRKILGPVFAGMEHKWWVDELYQLLFVNTYNRLAAFLADNVDWRFWHDWFHDSVLVRSFKALTGFLAQGFDLRVIDAGFNSLAKSAAAAASGLRKLQTGYVRSYALSVFVGVILVLSYFLFA